MKTLVFTITLTIKSFHILKKKKKKKYGENYFNFYQIRTARQKSNNLLKTIQQNKIFIFCHWQSSSESSSGCRKMG